MDARIVDEPALTDEDLVARIGGGELPLFEIVMRRYNQRLFRVARAIVRADDEAEDVVQQAYLSAFRHLRQFAGRARFSTWLTQIAIHEALARVRHHARLAEVPLEARPVDPAATDPSPEEQASMRELTGMIEAAVDELPETYRVVFVLREVQQLDVAETAACLELSEENVKVRLHRAKRMLRDLMSRRLASAAPSAFAFLGARCDRIVAVVMARLGDLDEAPPV